MGKSNLVYGSIETEEGGNDGVGEMLIHAQQKGILNPITKFTTEKGIEEEILTYISEEQYETLLNQLDACLESWNDYNHKTLIRGVIFIVISLVLLLLMILDLVVIVIAAIVDNGTLAVIFSVLIVGFMVGGIVLPCIFLTLIFITCISNHSKVLF